MAKRTRTLLFLSLVAVFLVLAPVLLLYSQGYRIDWSKRQLSQVGAFYLSVVPTRAEVFINEKSIGRTAYVLGTTLTESFPAGVYQIRIQKEGYHPWEKKLEIMQKQVTEAKHIALLPAKPVFVALQDNVQAIWFAPNKTEALLQKSNPRNTWTLILWDTQRNLEYPLYESPRLQDEIQSVQWASNSNSFLFHIASQEQIRSYAQRIDRGLLARQNTTAESLRAAAQIREEHILDPLLQDAVAFLENGEQLLWLDRKGILWQRTNRNAQTLQLNQKPFVPRAETFYAIHVIGSELFIQENQKLFLFNQQTQAFEEFFAQFQEMMLSPDAKKLALSTGKEIWLYFLQEDREQPQRRKGEKVFLTRFSEDIANLTWFDSHYLMFVRGEAIMVAEIDTRDRLNMVEIASFPNPAIVWHDAAKTLFVHSGGQIRASEKLLP